MRKILESAMIDLTAPFRRPTLKRLMIRRGVATGGACGFS